ncbi:hypothetical protein HYPSUDRAFT_61516 [Hypholoma sublateritium FD-334 SS-4]|uniref:F-box domain-containing protein n=1 Tax=Hypholoma sublateritium (strain FD-334 SS-4) TaxID=945553 RepID=A0A0D2MZB9_HYPSF|nr:hypothetical protein HYPSUDRAFT_61516 [Hypholoma sublateritium FD-334 SS-4]
MQAVRRTIPPEILDAFIDELGRNPAQSDCRCALQQCSFVSRAFRNRAHHYLFSKVEFVQRPYSTPSEILSRLWQFRNIVHRGTRLPMTGLLHHLRSFKLVMDGSIFEAYAILENEDLVEILRAIQVSSKDFEAFAIHGSSFPIVWPDLTTDFRAVFRNLCRTMPNLTTLNLVNIVGVPHTLLMRTNIRDIRFHLIEFKKPRMAFVIFREGHLPKGQLESIDIDYTFPFPPSNLIESRLAYEDAMAHYRTIFSQVKKLRYLIYRSDDLERFIAVARGLSSSLEVVNLELTNSDNGFLRALSWEIPLADLPLLRRLIICHKSLISTGTRHPLFKVATVLKNVSVPVCMEAVELLFEVSAQAPWLKAMHFFPEPEIWALLDTALTNRRFDAVRSVVLRLRYCVSQEPPWTFDEGVFIGRCHDLVKDVFPLLAGSKSKKLELVVSFTTGFEEAKSQINQV